MLLVKLDTISFWGLILRICLWFMAVGAFIGIGMAGPAALKRFTFSAYCKGVTDGSCTLIEMSQGGVWKAEVNALVAANQLLLLDFQTEYGRRDGGISSTSELLVTTSVYGYNGEEDAVEYVLANQTHTRQLVCNEGVMWCDWIHLIHQSWIQYENYGVVVDFAKSNKEAVEFIRDVVFEFVTVNEQYTEFAIVVKWLYILVSLEVFFLFRRRMALLRDNQWSTPQTWISWLMIGLILFNDPLCILSPLGVQSTWITPLVSALLQVTFCFLLLLFWLVVLDELHQSPENPEESHSFRRTFWKCVMVAAVWVMTCTLLIWLRVNEASDPMLTYPSDFPYFLIFRDVCLALAAVYFFWLIMLVNEATDKLASYQPEFRRFMTTLFLSVILLAFFVLGTLVGALPYITEGEIIHNKGWHFAAMYSIVNWYCYALAYLFSPTNEDPDTVYDALSSDRTGLFADDL